MGATVGASIKWRQRHVMTSFGQLLPSPAPLPSIVRQTIIACPCAADVDWHSPVGSASPRGGVMGLDERKMEVLRAIVEDYVATQEPVGSKSLVERHNLRVSPATVRNDMAVLEEEGYIRQPHTSAGRVPTDAGYRLFVDKLSRVKPLSQAERRAIERFLIGAVDLDDVVHRTVRLLAQLTRQVAVVQYPSLSRASVRHFELVPISTTRLMVVMIAETGRVEQRLVELPGPILADDVTELRRVINDKLVGRRLADTPPLVVALVEETAPSLRPP